MKPLTIVLFLLLTLFGNETIYRLPQEYNLLIASLKTDCAKATHDIVLMTDHLAQRELRDALKKAARRGIKVTLITHVINDASALALYQNIDVRLITPIDSPAATGIISMSLIAIDSNVSCLGTTPLDTTSLSHDIALFTCKSSYENVLTYWMQQSQSYLKE